MLRSFAGSARSREWARGVLEVREDDAETVGSSWRDRYAGRHRGCLRQLDTPHANSRAGNLPLRRYLRPPPRRKSQATPTGKSQVTPTERPQVTPTERPQVTPTEKPQVAPTEEPQVDPQEADALRKLAFAYWEAFNAYDADRALGYLEEDYRQQQDSAVRDDIGMIKLFSVKLGVSEETPPQVVGNDEWEMYLTMKEPLGTRRIRMAFQKVEGEWKITFAEEAK